MSAVVPRDIASARLRLTASEGTPVRLDVAVIARRIAEGSTPSKLRLRLLADESGADRQEIGNAWVFPNEWYPGVRGNRYSHYFLSLVRAFEGLERSDRAPELRLQLLRAVRSRGRGGSLTVLLKFIIAPEYALTGSMLETVYGCPLAGFYTSFVGVTFDARRNRTAPDYTRGNAIHAGYRRAAEAFVRDRRLDTSREAYFDGVRASWTKDIGALLMDRPKSGPRKLHRAPVAAVDAVMERCVAIWPEEISASLLHERLVYSPTRGLSGRIDRVDHRGPLIHLTEIKTGGGFGRERDPLTNEQHAGGVQALVYRELLAASSAEETTVEAFVEELENETPSLFPLRRHPVVTRAGATLEPDDDRGLDLLAQNRNVGFVAGSGLLTGYDRHRLDETCRRSRYLPASGGDWSLSSSAAPCAICPANSRGICAQTRRSSVAPIDNLFRYAPPPLFAYWAWFHHQLRDEDRRGREWLYHLATAPSAALEQQGVTVSGLHVADLDGMTVELARERPIATRMREDDRVLVGLSGLRPGDARSVEGTIEAIGERHIHVRLDDRLPDHALRYRVDDLSRHGMPDWQTQGLTDFLISAMEATPVRGRELDVMELPRLAQIVLGAGSDPAPLPAEPAVPPFVSGLNEVQRRAVGAALEQPVDGGEPLLIQGPPGTGKTTMIAELVHAIAVAEFGRDASASSERPVLLLANSHRAVDELVLKLVGRYPDLVPFIVRVGRPRSGMDAAVRARVLGEGIGAREALATVDLGREGPERLVALIRQGNLLHDQAMVFAATLAAAQSAELRGLSFRTVIVDECGQATEPAALQALRHMVAGFRSRLVLVGDHQQLPPVVPEADAERPASSFEFPPELAESGLQPAHTLKTSLFERLSGRFPNRLIALSEQYRMNEAICSLVSDTFYGGRLRPGTPDVAARNLREWLETAGIAARPGLIATGPPVLFIDTSNDPNGLDRDTAMGDDARANEHEAMIIADLVGELLDGLSLRERQSVLAELGVISPYRRQNNAILHAFARLDPTLGRTVRVDTVDRFQGGEKEIVLISLTNSNREAAVGRLHADWRRMNVAISRARRTLVLVGDRRTFTAEGIESEEEAKRYYRCLFAGIDRLAARGEARIIPSRELEVGR